MFDQILRNEKLLTKLRTALPESDITDKPELSEESIKLFLNNNRRYPIESDLTSIVRYLLQKQSGDYLVKMETESVLVEEEVMSESSAVKRNLSFSKFDDENAFSSRSSNISSYVLTEKVDQNQSKMVVSEKRKIQHSKKDEGRKIYKPSSILKKKKENKENVF